MGCFPFSCKPWRPGEQIAAMLDLFCKFICRLLVHSKSMELKHYTSSKCLAESRESEFWPFLYKLIQAPSCFSVDYQDWTAVFVFFIYLVQYNPRCFSEPATTPIFLLLPLRSTQASLKYYQTSLPLKCSTNGCDLYLILLKAAAVFCLWGSQFSLPHWDSKSAWMLTGKLAQGNPCDPLGGSYFVIKSFVCVVVKAVSKQGAC